MFCGVGHLLRSVGDMLDPSPQSHMPFDLPCYSLVLSIGHALGSWKHVLISIQHILSQALEDSYII